MAEGLEGVNLVSTAGREGLHGTGRTVTMQPAVLQILGRRRNPRWETRTIVGFLWGPFAPFDSANQFLEHDEQI
jgi:hypothetical protein